MSIYASRCRLARPFLAPAMLHRIRYRIRAVAIIAAASRTQTALRTD